MEFRAQLKAYMNRYVDFGDEELDMFYSALEHVKFKRKEFLLEEGQVCRYKYFIVKGLLRIYYIDNKGSEKITQFGVENWWVTNMESFINETPGVEFIQAVENTEVLRISKEKLERAYVTIPKLERVFRIISQKMLIAWQRKNEVYLKQNGKDKYREIINNLPEFCQRIPQYMIASYIEISPEYLSEIRKG